MLLCLRSPTACPPPETNGGPEAVLVFHNSGAFGAVNQYRDGFWYQFGGFTTTYGDLCYPAGVEATRLTYGQVIHNAPWDLAKAGLIILWGKNPAEINLQEMTHIYEALASGARLV